jgi:predicted acylesterase/phospholipase RssA
MKFSGGGIYFWWQAGAAKFLSEQCTISDLSTFPVMGSSAGALCATLFVNGASFDAAAKFAINQAYENNLFEKKLG